MAIFLLLASLIIPAAHAYQCPGFQNPQEEAALLDEGAESTYNFLLAKFKKDGLRVKQLMLSEESAWLGALGDCGAKNYSTKFEVVYQSQTQACIVTGAATYFSRFNGEPTLSVVPGSESVPDCRDLSGVRK